MYQIKNYDSLLGLPGFSDQALNTHFALYKGYVDNTNKLLETRDNPESRRRLGWEFNGMRLHEYYFETLTKDPKPLNENSELAKKIIADFGSIENWQKDFKATTLMRGIGWAIFYYDPVADKLINFWIEQHHSGHPAGLKLLLNLDLFEHAFLIDYGTKKADYVGTFLKAVDWEKVEQRLSRV